MPTSPTNEQAVAAAEAKIAELKEDYIKILSEIVSQKAKSIEPELPELLKCQQAANRYFNFAEEFVGKSGLLGAHDNGYWITGFAETCHAILEVYVTHMQFLRGYSQKLGGTAIEPSEFAYANLQRMIKEYLPKEVWKATRQKFEDEKLPTKGFSNPARLSMKSLPTWHLVAAISIGAGFMLILLVLAVMIPNPTEAQMKIFWPILAVAVASFGSILPGFLEIHSRIKAFSVSAGGALAIFFIVWKVTPAILEHDPAKAKQEHSESAEAPVNLEARQDTSQGTSVKALPSHRSDFIKTLSMVEIWTIDELGLRIKLTGLSTAIQPGPDKKDLALVEVAYNNKDFESDIISIGWRTNGTNDGREYQIELIGLNAETKSALFKFTSQALR